MNTSRRMAAMGAATVTFALAGCGSTSATTGNGETAKDGGTIFSDAVAALKQAKSAHLKSTMSGTIIDADLVDGAFGGAVTTGGQTFDVKVKGTSSWIKAGAPYWESQSPGLGACLADKWVTVPANSKATSDMAGFADFNKLASSFQTTGNVSKGPESTVLGSAVVELKGSDGSMFVATDGKPYPVRISGKTPADGSFDFTGWDATPAVAAPPDAVDAATACAPGGSAPATAKPA